MLSSHAILAHSRSFFRRVLTVLFPPHCLICGAPCSDAYYLCSLCLQDLPSVTQHCPQCGQFLPTETSLLCGSCMSSPPAFDKTYVLFPYETPIIQLITGLKFQHKLAYAETLASLMRRQIRTTWYQHQPLPDVLLPLPLHPLRLKERGFNQAVEIARPIAKSLHLSLDLHGLKRIKHTTAQSGLTANERKHNMARAFSATRDYSGLSVAVIDDVMTTGHTLRACSAALKKSGAKEVVVWCCARRG